MYGKCTHWNGHEISSMSTQHIKNTIAMLRRKIDGSTTDEVVYDYIISMEAELKSRNIAV